MNGLALCSGIGALEIGVCLAVQNYRTVCYVEREAFAAACLAARMDEGSLAAAPIWDNLETFRGAEWCGAVDIISAGFPCQPFSSAGKQRGLADERWIWPAIADIISDVGPGWVFLENVPGLRRHGLTPVLTSLAERGYNAAWDCFSAAGVGAPHNRRRFYILAKRVSDPYSVRLWQRAEPGTGRACAPDQRDAKLEHLGTEQLGDTNGPGLEGSRGPADTGQRSSGEAGSTVANTQHEGQRQQCPPHNDNRGHAQWDYPDRCNEGIPHWPPGPNDVQAWSRLPARFKPAVCRMADGAANRVDRLRALGNAVVPACAATAFTVLHGRLS